MTLLNQKVFSTCAEVEAQLAALQAFIAAKKELAKTTALTDWGELGDVTNVRDLLEQIPVVQKGGA